MSSIKLLPFLEGTKFIIVDEGLEAAFGETLITGWLKTFESKRPDCKIDIISFSNPKHIYVNHLDLLKISNVSVTDFYSLKSNETDFLDEKLKIYLPTVGQNSVIILNCLSTLILTVGLETALWFVKKLEENSEKLIAIYRRDFGKLNLPNVETMGSTYVKLEEHLKTTQTNNFIYEVFYTHKKWGGSILRQTELVRQDINTYEIISTKILKNAIEKLKNTAQEPVKEVKASFRIEMNDQEMTQKNNTPLPYINSQNQTRQTTIFYEPEDYDDDEEEDLDDDLGI